MVFLNNNDNSEMIMGKNMTLKDSKLLSLNLLKEVWNFDICPASCIDKM